MAAGCVFVDEDGRVLLVKPTYKEAWELPGGGVERDESPLLACIREVAEELGLERRPQRLLGVDYRAAVPGVRGDALRFVFDGGCLSPAEIEALRLPPDELSEWRFVATDDLDTYLVPAAARRLRTLLQADEATYLEEGAAVLPPRT